MAMAGAGVGKDVKGARCIAMKMLMAMLVVMLVLVSVIICAAAVADMVMMMLMARLVVMFVLASMIIHVAVVVFMIMRVIMMMMMDRFGRLVLYYGILAGLKIEDARSCGISTSAMFAH
jgi:hypothetical protein